MSRLVYFVAADSVNLVKIGSSGDPERRFAELQLLSPVPLSVIGLAEGGYEKEAELHRRFAHLRSHGEWFHATGELKEFISGEIALGALLRAWSRACPEAREIFLSRIDTPVADNTTALRAVQ